MVRDFVSDMHKVITAHIPLMSVDFASTDTMDTMVTFKVLFWVFPQSLIHIMLKKHCLLV